jgi:hypothetical protein
MLREGNPAEQDRELEPAGRQDAEQAGDRTNRPVQEDDQGQVGQGVVGEGRNEQNAEINEQRPPEGQERKPTIVGAQAEAQVGEEPFEKRLREAVKTAKDDGNLDGLNAVLENIPEGQQEVVNKVYAEAFRNMIILEDNRSGKIIPVVEALYKKIDKSPGVERELHQIDMGVVGLVKNEGENFVQFRDRVKEARRLREEDKPDFDGDDSISEGQGDDPEDPAHQPGARDFNFDGLESSRERILLEDPEQSFEELDAYPSDEPERVEGAERRVGQPLPPMAGRPEPAREIDPINALKDKIKNLNGGRLTVAQLKALGEAGSSDNPDVRKQLIREEFFRSLGPAAGLAKEYKEDARIKALVDKKVESIYNQLYEESGKLKEGVTNEMLNKALDEVCSGILMQAYFCGSSYRPYNAAKDVGAKEKYKDSAVQAFEDGKIGVKNITDALKFEDNQNAQWFSSASTFGNKLWHKAGRALTWLPYGAARVPGNIADNIKDAMEKNPITSAMVGSGIFIFASLFIPGALPIAIVYGTVAVLLTSVGVGIKKFYNTTVGENFIKAVGTALVAPFDLVATLLVGAAALVTSVIEGKGFLETMDKMGYKPFSIIRAVIKPKEPEVKRDFSDKNKGGREASAKEKDAISKELSNLSLDNLAKAFGDDAIRAYMSKEGILKQKLEEFFNRNPNEAQVKTMLQNNPELQRVIQNDPTLAANDIVQRVMPQVQAQAQPQPAQAQPPVQVHPPVQQVAAQPRPEQQQPEQQQEERPANVGSTSGRQGDAGNTQQRPVVNRAGQEEAAGRRQPQGERSVVDANIDEADAIAAGLRGLVVSNASNATNVGQPNANRRVQEVGGTTRERS